MPYVAALDHCYAKSFASETICFSTLTNNVSRLRITNHWRYIRASFTVFLFPPSPLINYFGLSSEGPFTNIQYSRRAKIQKNFLAGLQDPLKNSNPPQILHLKVRSVVLDVSCTDNFLKEALLEIYESSA